VLNQGIAKPSPLSFRCRKRRPVALLVRVASLVARRQAGIGTVANAVLGGRSSSSSQRIPPSAPAACAQHPARCASRARARHRAHLSLDGVSTRRRFRSALGPRDNLLFVGCAPPRFPRFGIVRVTLELCAPLVACILLAAPSASYQSSCRIGASGLSSRRSFAAPRAQLRRAWLSPERATHAGRSSPGYASRRPDRDAPWGGPTRASRAVTELLLATVGPPPPRCVVCSCFSGELLFICGALFPEGPRFAQDPAPLVHLEAGRGLIVKARPNGRRRPRATSRSMSGKYDLQGR